MKGESDRIEGKIVDILGSGTYLIYVFIAVILLILAALSLLDAVTGFGGDAGRVKGGRYDGRPARSAADHHHH
ncbi:hypothetical protein [Methanogenium cariaci]|uniref:hypothetical protein n=1 Tax=Methanogenium cariaci TaxID=2197 RepID=UPI0007818245|nr:hypothetical protein [Methanogenium cariaci]